MNGWVLGSTLLAFVVSEARAATDEVDVASLGAACRAGDAAACSTLRGWTGRRYAQSVVGVDFEAVYRKDQLEQLLLLRSIADLPDPVDPGCVPQFGPLADRCALVGQGPRVDAPDAYGPAGERVYVNALGIEVVAGDESYTWRAFGDLPTAYARYDADPGLHHVLAGDAIVVANGYNPRRYAALDGRTATLDLGEGTHCADVATRDAIWVATRSDRYQSGCTHLARYGWDGARLGSWDVSLTGLVTDGVRVVVKRESSVELWSPDGAVATVPTSRNARVSVGDGVLAIVSDGRTSLWRVGADTPVWEGDVPCVIAGEALACATAADVEIRDLAAPDVVAAREPHQPRETQRAPRLSSYRSGQVVYVDDDVVVRDGYHAPDAAALAAWPRQPTDANLSGIRRVTGRVVTRGLPVQGATVTFARPAPELNHAVPSGHRADPEWIAPLVDSEVPLGTAVTDASGAFAFDAPADGWLVVRFVDDDGNGSAMLPPGARAITIELAVSSSEVWRVTEPGGEPAVGAKVVADGASYLTDERGEVRLPYAETLVAVKGERAAKIVGRGGVGLYKEVGELVLKEPRPMCSITWSTGAPWPESPMPCDAVGAMIPRELADRVRYGACTSSSCAISVVNRALFEVPGWDGTGYASLVGDASVVRSEQSREIVDVPSGRYQAYFQPYEARRGMSVTSGRWLFGADVDIRQGDVTVTTGAAVLRPRVDVRVVDPDGRPVGGARVASRDPLAGTWGMETTGPDGVASIASDAHGRVAVALYAGQAVSSRDDYGPPAAPTELVFPDAWPEGTAPENASARPRAIRPEPAAWWVDHHASELLVGTWRDADRAKVVIDAASLDGASYSVTAEDPGVVWLAGEGVGGMALFADPDTIVVVSEATRGRPRVMTRR